MAKNLKIAVLLDFYGQMLTEKQRGAIELYYNEDLSLAEISEHSGITRQGVRDSIKRAELQLLEYEEKLGLALRFRTIKEGLDEIIRHAGELQAAGLRSGSADELYRHTQRIIDVAGSLNS
ncbi:YlxM family DNA-binding protein [Oscillospiraceae bacterium MB08-C2-2]|nr:YlxM family DNA-binding protein [Oscillospiraceae bacterium MB08-C2-2]